MNLLYILVVLCSVTSLVNSKPYQYSYYVSLPGNYQSLAVNDGIVSLSSAPPAPPITLNAGPGFRTGRVDPVFRQNPELGGQYPINSGIPTDPNFRSRGYYPGFNQNPGLDGRIPISPGNQLSPGGFNPYFNQNPSFGRRIPDRNGPDFSRRRDDPDNEDIPDGELDPQFNGDRPFRGFSGRPDFRNGRRYPNDIPNGEFDPQYNRDYPYSPEFGNRIQPISPRRRGISRREKPQEIDENSKSTTKTPETNESNSTDEDKEEVTTPQPPQPCSFCGTHKINPMDGIDGSNVEPDPDSEPVEPRNVNGVGGSGVVIQNTGDIPVSASGQGYLFNNPFVTYYVVPSV